MFSASSASSRENRHKQKRTENKLLNLLSSVGPHQQVDLNNKSSRQRTPHLRRPKPLSREQPYRDRNLKGQDTHIRSISPEKSEQQSETDQKPNNSPTKPKQWIRENLGCECGVAGPMGRPDVLRCRGGDRDTEGANGSSRPGNRPTHASINKKQKRSKNLRIKVKVAQRFAGSFLLSKKAQTGTRQDGHISYQSTYIQVHRYIRTSHIQSPC